MAIISISSLSQGDTAITAVLGIVVLAILLVSNKMQRTRFLCLMHTKLTDGQRGHVRCITLVAHKRCPQLFTTQGIDLLAPFSLVFVFFLQSTYGRQPGEGHVAETPLWWLGVCCMALHGGNRRMQKDSTTTAYPTRRTATKIVDHQVICAASDDEEGRSGR